MFYDPKIDVQVWSVIGREFTLATNRVDFDNPGAIPKCEMVKDILNAICGRQG
jgi:hypothetical protein